MSLIQVLLIRSGWKKKKKAASAVAVVVVVPIVVVVVLVVASLAYAQLVIQPLAVFVVSCPFLIQLYFSLPVALIWFDENW